MMWVVRILLGFASLQAFPAVADSWMPPTRATYLSASKDVRFTVTPRELRDQLGYFSDKVDGKEPAGQRPGGEPRARGKLERQTGPIWTTIWEGPLANDVSPVSALIADDGAYVVTFDNWHSTGWGENVVVIYRADGSIVRSMKLADVVPEEYIRALPRSVSSLWWSGEHELRTDQKQLVLKVVIPNRSGSIGSPRGYLDVPIDLASGRVAPLSGQAWDNAMAAAAPLIAQSKAEEAAWRAEMIAPLVAPVSADETEWQRYIYQAASRLVAPRKGGMGFDLGWILPAVSDPNFAREAKNIREVFTEWDEESDLSFASPAAPAELARLLGAGARAGKPDRLRGYRLFIALPAALSAEIEADLKRTGATIILIDPASSIPHRPEVLRELGVSEDQVAAEAEKAAVAARLFDAEAKRLNALAPPEPKNAAGENEKGLEEMADQLEEAADQLRKQAGDGAKPK